MAERLGVNPKTVRNWIAEGRLQAHKFGKLFRISEGALAEFEGIGPVTSVVDPSRLNSEAVQHLDRAKDLLEELAVYLGEQKEAIAR